jgi:hypothetical protein
MYLRWFQEERQGHVEDDEEEEFELTRPSKLMARQLVAQKNVKSPAVRGKRVHVLVKNVLYSHGQSFSKIPFLTFG